ncbi:MAG: hypothetical protein KDD53_02900 [Bdellovibrionales bacterium]|nr:hypothetical protein [Bdellovibrionales bacterium]
MSSSLTDFTYYLIFIRSIFHLVFALFLFLPAVAADTDVLFTEVAKVKSTPFCAGYSVFDNCYNMVNPEPPSISRSLMRAIPFGPSEIDQKTIPFPGTHYTSIPNTVGSTVVMPFSRSTNDGRLTLVGGGDFYEMGFRVVRPENVNYDLKLKSVSRPVYSPPVSLHFFMYSNPLETDLPYAFQGQNFRPYSWQNTICQDSGAGVVDGKDISANESPRHCRAKLLATDESYINGDCYDISIVNSMHVEPQNAPDGFKHWELRSSRLTVFVSPGKGVTGTPKIWIYPRNLNFDLPPYQPYANVFSIMSQIPYDSQSPLTNHYAQVVDSQCNSVSPPAWCEYFSVQDYTDFGFVIDENANNIPESSEVWSGINSGKSYELFELSTSSDGKILLLNYKGLGYSLNSLEACNAAGWSFIKPISQIPFDPGMIAKYSIASSQNYCVAGSSCAVQPFRDTQGDTIAPGQSILGGYPWLDREAKTLFFSHVTERRDGYFADSYSPSFVGPTPDQGNGKGVSVLGHWTHGKIVHLDVGANFTDFGGVDHQEQAQFNLKLYDTETPTVIRPEGWSQIFSEENHFNYFDSLSPQLPFDVVWRASFDNQRSSEIVFDEYLNSSALVVAHMNAPIKIDYGYNFSRFLDGFISTNPGQNLALGQNPDYYFATNPLLQNAATTHPFFSDVPISPPSNLRLRGGARVEPVNLGGVLGRGVYLDGENDWIDTGYINPDVDDWYFGIWLDIRGNANTLRTLFYFPDNSWIGISKNKLVAFNASSAAAGAPIREQSIFGLVQKGKYFHLGVKIYTHNNQRWLRFYVNGTALNPGGLKFPVGSLPYDEGFSLKLNPSVLGGWSWFTVGDPGPSFTHPLYPSLRNTLHAWIDEFKVYALGIEEQKTSSYFNEFMCNQALGTLVDVYASDLESSNPHLVKLANIAVKHGILPFGGGLGPYLIPTYPMAVSSLLSGSLPFTAVSYLGLDPISLSPRPYFGRSNNYAFSGVRPVRVCEQMKLESYVSVLDFPDQYGSGLCIDKVHRNQSSDAELASRCVRKKVLKIKNLGLTPFAPRPDFSQVDFCHSCHTSLAGSGGLGLGSLSYMPALPRIYDLRRQPLDHPGIISGCNPSVEPFLSTFGIGCFATPYELDTLFDGAMKVVP